MLVVCLLLLAAAQSVPELPEKHVAPSPPDWFLYGLAIAAVAAGFHFFRTLSAQPPSQRIPPPHLQQQEKQQPDSTTSAMAADPNKAWTLAELKEYNGTDASKPLLLGCGGKVFDVSSARGFYGPGAAYGVFAGKDASRGLARMEIEYRVSNGTDPLTDAPASAHSPFRCSQSAASRRCFLCAGSRHQRPLRQPAGDPAGGQSLLHAPARTRATRPSASPALSTDLIGSVRCAVGAQWADKFASKYPVVGRIVDSSEPNSGSASTTTDGANGQTANPLVSSAPGV